MEHHKIRETARAVGQAFEEDEIRRMIDMPDDEFDALPLHKIVADLSPLGQEAYKRIARERAAARPSPPPSPPPSPRPHAPKAPAGGAGYRPSIRATASDETSALLGSAIVGGIGGALTYALAAIADAWPAGATILNGAALFVGGVTVLVVATLSRPLWRRRWRRLGGILPLALAIVVGGWWAGADSVRDAMRDRWNYPAARVRVVDGAPAYLSTEDARALRSSGVLQGGEYAVLEDRAVFLRVAIAAGGTAGAVWVHEIDVDRIEHR